MGSIKHGHEGGLVRAVLEAGECCDPRREGEARARWYGLWATLWQGGVVRVVRALRCRCRRGRGGKQEVKAAQEAAVGCTIEPIYERCSAMNAAMAEQQ